MDNKKNTIIFYTDKSKEEAIVIENIFKDYKKVLLYPIWNREFEYLKHNNIFSYHLKDLSINQIESELREYIESENIQTSNLQVIFYGINQYIVESIKYIKEKYSDIKIKVISDIYEGILFNHPEFNSFFEILKLLKTNEIYKLYFMKKSIANTYKNLGYNVGYLMQNYKLSEEEKVKSDNIYTNELNNEENAENKKNKEELDKSEKISDLKIKIGYFNLDDVWNKNVYNTISVAKMIDGSVLNFHMTHPKEFEFAQKLEINANIKYLGLNLENQLISNIKKNDLIIDLDFTSNVNLSILIAMELKKLVFLGNIQNLFDDLNFKYKELIVTNREDDPNVNSKCIKEIYLQKNINKDKLKQAIYDWKQEYNKLANQNLEMLISE